MINQNIMELIHASVDGELDASQQAELDLALSSFEEARQYRANLLEFNDVLGRERTIELPEGLHRKIVDGIKLPSKPLASFGWGGVPGIFRYGMAAAAGFVLAVGLVDSQPVNMTARDLDSMVGTIMPASDSVPTVTLDTFSFDLAGVSSSVSLLNRNQSLVLEVTMDTLQPVDISIDFSGERLVFDAIAQIQSDLDSIGVTGQAIQISGQGKQHFAVLLHRESGPVEQSEASFRLGFFSNGQLVKEGTLVTK